MRACLIQALACLLKSIPMVTKGIFFMFVGAFPYQAPQRQHVLGQTA